MTASRRPNTRDEFQSLVAELRRREGYTEPVAFGIGVATIADADDSVLDTYFGTVNLDENLGSAAIIADVVGHDGSAGTLPLGPEHIEEVLARCAPVVSGPDPGAHPNLAVLQALSDATPSPSVLPTHRQAVITFITDLSSPPSDASDVYLRLHLLSHRKVRPHGVNLDGQFALLANVVWSTLGPCDVASFEVARRSIVAAGTPVSVTSVDKFPRMTDYVIPTGVRIADADRVRLGAHLAEGTTVMHEGFVNFNAGTLGPAMVEGRITAGVVVGPDSDIGGGASIMGTLSGGGNGGHHHRRGVPDRGQRRGRDLARRQLHRRGRSLPDRGNHRDAARRLDRQGPASSVAAATCCSDGTRRPGRSRCVAAAALGRTG